MSSYVVRGGKALRRGFTTGSCATAAASAAAEMLLTGKKPDQILITLPSGGKQLFPVENHFFAPGKASCSIQKDAGDDPDVTDGLSIFATCERIPDGLEIHGGEGIGVVSAQGLSLPVGEAAITPTPRNMILENVGERCRALAYPGGLSITISAPGGEAIAKKTFNPRLGIVGGISILGSTGIVEPMSEKAMIDTIKLLIDQRRLSDPHHILIAPGNYGLAFCRDHLGLDPALAVKYGNYLGECLDYLAYRDFRRVLLVGHSGKLIKTAGGIMNSHSSVADCRMEILAAHAALAGAQTNTIQSIMEARTTDEGIRILAGTNHARAAYQSILDKLQFHLRHRAGQNMETGVIVFTRYGDNANVLMQSANATDLVALFTPRASAGAKA